MFRTLTPVLINAAMGTIYLWSLFLLPLESSLGLTRSDLSLVPSLSLVSFTAGMVAHARILQRIGAFRFALLAFVLAGGGQLFFGISASYATLIVGYGVMFGLGAGLGYGLALAIVTTVASTQRALAIGLTMAAFASSGIVLPLLLGPFIRTIPPSTGFALVGAGILVIGAAVISLIAAWKLEIVSTDDGAAQRASPASVDGNFLALGLAFFALCFAGLMAVSQAAGITAANGLSQQATDTTVSMLTVGYLAGSLLGGKLVELISGRYTLVVAAVASALGVWLLDLTLASVAIVGAVLVGGAFGASASFMPVLIGELYGTNQIGSVYGRLMISYGLAGLVAPALSGWLFEMQGDYGLAVFLAIGLCVVAGLIGLLMNGRPADRRIRYR